MERNQSPTCPFPMERPESIEHTIFLCPWAARVWFANCIAYRPLPQAFTSLDSSAVWKTRCNLVYDKSNFCPSSPELTSSLANRSVVEFLSHMRLKDDRNHFNNPPLDSHLWVNPPVGT
ncbi:unnamed protein product, partial [Prunus brigantina]